MKDLISVRFSDLTIWDVKNYFRQNETFNNKYPLVLFGYFLKKSKIKKIKILDEQQYSILGVRSYGKGVYINRVVKGNTLKMRTYQLAPDNHLFWCKVDTKNGAFGIIKSEFVDSIASSNMTFAEIDTSRIIPEYLQILFKSPKINSYMDGYVTGTTNRKYIKPNQLLEEIKIPLPSLIEQNSIVNNYKQKITLAKQQDEKASKLEKEIEEYLYAVLGISKKLKVKKTSLLDTIAYREVDRWAVDSLGRLSKIESKFKGHYPLIKFKDLIYSTQYGLSEKSSREKIGPPMLRMNNINNGDLQLDNLKYIKIDETTYQKYKLNKGDLLFNRTNSKELVGKTALFDSDKEYTFASYLIRVVLKEDIVNKEYINYLFNSSILQFQKNLVSRQITGQANINAQEMKEFLFPIPEIDEQNSIADHITKLKKQIKILKEKATKNKQQALIEFEKEMFS